MHIRRSRSRFAIVFAAITVGVLGAFASSAKAYVGANPTAPYRDTTLDQQFWDLVKSFDDPSQEGTEGDLVRTGLYDSRIASRLLPAVSALGTFSLSVGAFELGWKIGRGIDTRWLHLTGDVGEVPQGAPGVWSMVNWSATRYCNYAGDPCISNSWFVTESPQGGTYSHDTRYRDATAADAALSVAKTGTATRVDVNHQYCDGYGGANPAVFATDCFVVVTSDSVMNGTIRIDRSEPYSNQAYSKSTDITIPADSGSAADLEAARVQLDAQSPEGDAAQKEINHALAPTDPRYPDPVDLEVVWSAPVAGETYSAYVSRLQAQGWIGTAVVTTLDPSDEDPNYGPGGVPCTSIESGEHVLRDQTVTFYVNPSPLGTGGQDSTGDDCHVGDVTVPPPDASPTTGTCEYDLTIPNLAASWEVSRRYGDPTRFDDACQAAWDYFLYSTPGATADTAQSDPNTGRLMDPDLRAALTADGSDISDWEKIFWGPFTITSRGETLSFVVKGYRNKLTNELNLSRDFKVKFETELDPYATAP